MSLHTNYKTLLVLGLAILLNWNLNAQSSGKPNIILLFADDAGYHDFGFQGSKTFPTPNLDKMASEGITFKQAYVTAAVCGPSRAALLTGMYQQRFGFEENNVPGYMSASGLDGDEMGLPTHLLTIADYLKRNGYISTIIGKWHQGGADRFHPLERGFDEFYGFRGGARSYFAYINPDKEDPQKKMEKGFRNFKEHEGYLTDALANEACDFILRNQNQPFFIYLSFNAVHNPMQANEEDLAKIKELSGKRKKLAAMNIALDRACGKVIDQLEKLGLTENTLIIFANDNGGPTDANSASNYPLSGCKANHLEGGIRVPCLMKWPGTIKKGAQFNYPISTLDFLPTFLDAAGDQPDTISVFDGVSLLPYLKGESDQAPHQMLFWKKENRGAIRIGDWKMLRFPDRPAELYNIAQDESEINNLASKYPEKVKAMYKLLFNWELGLERPLWQLKRLYEGKAAKRMDKYHR